MSVAVIGAGAWGKNIIRNLSELGALAAICDPDPEGLASYATAYPQASTMIDWRQLLATDIPALAIATPTPLHFEMARAALEAGKDVFVEKPLTHNSDEAQKLVQLAQARGCILMVGHLLLYQPAVAWVKDYLRSGQLGELYGIRHERLSLGRVRPAESVLWDVGVHDIAMLLYLLEQSPAAVRASGHRMLKLGVEDEVQVHLEFADGVCASLYSSWLWPETNRRTIIRGTRGMLVYDEVEQSVILYRKWIDKQLQNHDQGSEVVYRGAGEPLRLELQHFLECSRDRKAPLSDGRSAVAVIRLLERIDNAMSGAKS